MPNIHIYGPKERKCLTDEQEVTDLMTKLLKRAAGDSEFLTHEGWTTEGHVYMCQYEHGKKKLICVLRATRITGGKWWIVWDKDRLDMSNFNFKSEIEL